MDIILCRHAESLANTQSIYQGQSYDTDLSEVGQQQAKALAKALAERYTSIDRVYTSSLKRAQFTAVQICSRLLIDQPTVDDRIMEINLGLWEGKTKTEVDQQFPGQLDQWQQDPHGLELPQGETLEQVQARAFEFLNQFKDQQVTRIIVVSHDLLIRTTLTKLLRREFKDIWIYQLDAGGYSVLEFDGKRYQVAEINANDHLIEGNLSSDLTTHAL
jgi:probable phosphoglycerate mutase